MAPFSHMARRYYLLSNNPSRIKYWKPRYNNAGPDEITRTPVYILLANEAKRRSIEINPLASSYPPTTEHLSPLAVPYQSSSSLSSSPEDVDMLSSESSNSSLHGTWPDDDFKSPKVLISGKQHVSNPLCTIIIYPTATPYIDFRLWKRVEMFIA